MANDTLTVRIDHDWKKKLEELASKENETKSDLVRKVLIDYIKKQREKDKIKRVIAKEYAEGKISFDELIRVIGYEEARKVAFFVHAAEESFEKGLTTDNNSS
ncbi:MAG: ribbon-helix-helix protein, CopG family [Thermoplasmatota archaeon]